MSPDPNDVTLVHRTLEWAYDRALSGVPGAFSAEQLALDYRRGDGALSERVERLIRWQAAKSSLSGFFSAFGGAAALPVMLPLNITSVVYIQLRMVAAIAHLGGQDVRTDPVRTMAYACLCGNAAKDVFKEAGIVLSTRLVHRAIERVSAESLARINRAVGFRLVTKFGTDSVVTLGRFAPIVGGAVGAALDGAGTYAVGHVARRAFVANGRTVRDPADSGRSAQRSR